MKTIKWFAAMLLITLLTLTSVSCHTIRGMGRDIEEGGESIEDAADEAQY